MMDQRYTRLVRLAGIGEKGLVKLKKAKVVLVGCGTLGGAYALNLARLNLGTLRLIDRDIVEEHNLSTQLLFTEEDLQGLLPKAQVARKRLAAINSKLDIEACSADLTPSTAENLLSSADLIVDATDNFETRFLINDAAIKYDISWIYTGVVGYSGTVMAILPGRSACLRCLMESAPDTSELPTCETVGVWLAAAQAVAAVGLTHALRILTGLKPDLSLSELDFESGRWTRLKVKRKPDCPACGRSDFEYLDGRIKSQATRLCGRDTVYLVPDRTMKLDLSKLANRFQDALDVAASEDLLRLKVPEAEIYLFSDGRAFVKGVSDPARARAIFNRYITS